MGLYEYRALNHLGELVTGRIQAADTSQAIALLHDRALLPIDARGPGTARFALPFRTRLAARVPRRELAFFSQQVARMLQAGLPLERALGVVLDGGGARRGQGPWHQAAELVRDGRSLSQAMEAQGTAFPQSYVSLIRAAEASGQLADILGRAAAFLTRSEEVYQRFVSALIYPSVLIVVAIGAIGFIVFAVLPQFAPMLEQAGARLPFATRLLLAAAHTATSFWWLFPTVTIVGAVGSVTALRTAHTRAAVDQWLLRLPAAGWVIRRAEIGRFARAFGVMLGCGVDAQVAMQLATAAVSNAAIAHALTDASVRLRAGQGLTAPLEKSGLLPPATLQLLRTGEETGTLAAMLGEIADLCDGEVTRFMDRLLSLLVPAITVVMGVLVAFIVAALMMALVTVNGLAT